MYKNKKKTNGILDSNLSSRRQIKEALQQTDDAQHVALEILGEIADNIKDGFMKKRRRLSVGTLRECIKMESEYQTVAHETVYGFQETDKQSGWKTYHANTALGYCKICRKKHRVWQYLKI